jgi:hypothetical protein
VGLPRSRPILDFRYQEDPLFINVLAHVMSVSRSKMWRAPLAALVFLLPALASAETVLFTANGFVSVTGGPPIYNGRYVMKQSDFGFFWLDTLTLTPGHVQAESKCGGFQPPADSDLYVIGDCNGITNISSSGNVVLVRQFSGQCGATIHFCNGPRDDGHSRFTFALGTFAYLGDQGEIPDSTQTTDLAGRTWTLQPADSGGLNFVWQGSGQPTMPPTANATATNVSAGGRSDKNNYYGDKWQLQDTSTQGPTSVTWDFNYSSNTFAADETGTEGAEGTVIGYLPCDPKGVPSGDIRSGANCRQSLGLSNPAGQGNFQYAMRSANGFGPSANTFVSPILSFACPQAIIGGYSGFTGTCAKTGGTLTLAAGGNADASTSKGNLGEALFAWVFTSPSAPPVNLQGQSVPVPDGTNSFTLTITFPGGYQSTASGAVTLTGSSFVADFLTPSPVVRGSAFNLTNQMQKPATTTLNSVDSLINPGFCGAPPPIPPHPLAASFLTVGGTAAVTAPSPAGSYCIFLQFNYTPQFGTPTSQIVAHPLTVSEWSPIPAIAVYLDSGRTQPVQFFGSFFLTAGTTYYLFDEEPAPPSGVSYPGAQWSLVSSGAPVGLGATATQSPLPVIFTRSCSSGCSLKLVVGGATQQVPVAISPCTGNATTLCLNSSRFNVQVNWATADGAAGKGQAVVVTGDTGYFWFFSDGNVEMILKVVDGRAVNGAFWVFAGGLTNVAVDITVTDTQTGIVKVYHNPQGTAFQPIQDTATFVASGFPDPAATSEPALVPKVAKNVASDAAACATSPTTLCLNKSRFKVQTQWTTSDGRTGPGQAVALTGDTGYFWFFSANNVEMVVKVVDGCVVNSNYWAFSGGLTDVNVVMTITDTQTGLVKTYTNPIGVAFRPIQDTSAFASCP